jgi:hypothetical protein
MDDAAALEWLAKRRSFVVLGAMKCGTSSLRAHLRSTAWEDNSSIPAQELHFFDDAAEHAHGVTHYASWFNWGGDWTPQLIGDVTPSYLYIPQAVPRLREILPAAKLIVLLRNPIDRMISHHNHDLSKQRSVGTMTKRFRREVKLLDTAEPTRMDMVSRGLYHAQLGRLLQCFPASQLLVVISERYRSHTKRELNRVRAFLGLADLPPEFASEQLIEHHVRGQYLETLSETERASCRNFYAEDVAKLKLLLSDEIPEWPDFA